MCSSGDCDRCRLLDLIAPAPGAPWTGLGDRLVGARLCPNVALVVVTSGPMTGEPTGKVLVVEDDAAIGIVLVGLLSQGGLEARHVSSAEVALKELASGAYDVVLTDLQMPGMDGMALLRELKRRSEDLPVIMLTAHGSVPVAVEAMKSGAAEFMTKPFDRDEVLYTVRKALTALARTANEPPRLHDERSSLLGESDPMRACSELVGRAARTMATVLLRGESGTGKEVAARAIHEQGLRREGPFVVVNCAALPDQLLESELFGYEKGAFTGAISRKPGRVELATGGTLFLDEIGDVSGAVQVKLLRLLQEKEYQPLGSTTNHKADVRLLAATHRDLETMMGAGEYREDLFYRLNVVPIWMPPLRDRRSDIPALAEEFCERLGRDNHRPGLRLSRGALAVLSEQPWPGNVRELQNFVERLVVFSDGGVIDEADVSRELERSGGPRSSQTSVPAGDASQGDAASLASRRSAAERQAVLEALRRAEGNRTKAARLLGVSRRTLYNRLSEMGPLDL